MQEVLLSRYKHFAVFIFNWMVELHFILIPSQLIFIFPEIKIFHFQLPFVCVRSDPINEDCKIFFSWLINEDSLSIFILLKVMPLFTITINLIQFWIYFVHIFNQSCHIEAHLIWILELFCKFQKESEILFFFIDILIFSLKFRTRSFILLIEGIKLRLDPFQASKVLFKFFFNLFSSFEIFSQA